MARLFPEGFFEEVPEVRSSFDRLVWWERRRLAYNLFVFTLGVPCFVVFVVSILYVDSLGPGEDMVEPMAIFGAPFILNAAYCAGFVGETVLRRFRPQRAWGPLLLKAGFAFTTFAILFPAIFWGGVALLKLLGFHLIK